MIIDFHTHTFPDKICEKTLQSLSLKSATTPFSDGSISGLISSMERAGISYSVNLPVMTSPEQVDKVNTSMIENKEQLEKKGIIAFGGLHPDYEAYKDELQRLKAGGILGIKLHPAYQNVDLTDIRMLRIIEAASEQDMIILIHAGIDIGISHHNFASVSQILQVVDQVAPPKFVLAHMGNWGLWDQVESDLAGANVYLDTAFSVGKITPCREAGKAPIRSFNLTEEAFLRIVRKHGADKILFATDSPWEDQLDYVNRLSNIALTDKERDLIMGDNSRKLLRI